jgi:hypothetical protein
MGLVSEGMSLLPMIVAKAAPFWPRASEVIIIIIAVPLLVPKSSTDFSLKLVKLYAQI